MKRQAKLKTEKTSSNGKLAMKTAFAHLATTSNQTLVVNAELPRLPQRTVGQSIICTQHPRTINLSCDHASLDKCTDTTCPRLLRDSRLLAVAVHLVPQTFQS